MLHSLKGKKLYRSPRDAVILGVCAGVAKYFSIDPVFVRLLLIAAVFALNAWPAVVAYILAYLLMPMDPAQDTVAGRQEPKDVTDKHEGKQGGKTEPVERMDSDLNV